VALLALSKPQLGCVLAIILLLTMPRRRAVVSIMALVAGLELSYLAGMRAPDLETVRMWNVAPWPWGLLAGIPLVLWSFAKRDRELALGSALLVSPYWQHPSFIAAWPTTLRSRLLWLLWIIAAVLMLVERVGAILYHYRG
jgi:hypothetical protein